MRHPLPAGRFDELEGGGKGHVQTITVYPITGRQLGPVKIPSALCEECDLTLRAVHRVAEEPRDSEIRVEVKPWLRHALDALRRGGWHPPVVTVDGRVFSQGVVPDVAALKERLERQRAVSDRSAAEIRPVGSTGTPLP
jgi:hypothetical protein